MKIDREEPAITWCYKIKKLQKTIQDRSHMEQAKGSGTITLESLKEELIKRTTELVGGSKGNMTQ